jgi:hypothetical protein
MSSFLRNCHTAFQSGYTSLKFYQQCRNISLSPHPQQYHLLPEILILAILTGVRWKLRVLLVCVSLMTKNVEDFFRFFSTIQASSVENSLLSPVPHFK